ncbi:MAG: glutamate-1-semialdehyde 2,1-aminomutase [Phycisphaeraceae bacterium]
MPNLAPQTDRYTSSAAAFERASTLMPGGVSSPVRAFKAVGRTPITARSGKGATLTDIDGNDYIDYVGSYGPLILGHAPESVLVALSKAAAKGTTFGLTCENEINLAQVVVDAVPSIDRVRFVNSGTEAVMSAIRLARAATGRDKVIKCTGCYHGHSDALLVEAGSGAMTLGTPSSPGVPAAITSHTLLVPYNDLDAVEQVLEQQGSDVAAIVIEPIAGNMGCVPPQENYLAGLRELCDRHGTLLIFDEVMTGFRVHYGGAQTLYNVTPDLTCLGKIIGGGLPCAAYGGKAALMRQVAPEGPVYQAGTLSGNPLAMAAGLAVLETLQDDANYARLERTSAMLEDGLRRAAGQVGVPVQLGRVGSMITVFFADAPVTNYAQAKACRTDRYAAFFRTMLDEGVMLPPSQFETWFVSTAHNESCITQTLNAADAAFAAAGAVA